MPVKKINECGLATKGRKPTRIAFPVKVVGGIAVTFQVEAGLLAGRTVGKWDVVVCDFVEEVDFFLFQ